MKVPWADRNPPLRRISPSGPADHMDVGEYPLKQLQAKKPCEFKPPAKRAKPVLRWGQYFFLLVGLLGVGWYGFVYAEAKVYQTYQGWRLDRILKHQPAR